jgi:hypothetical protein
LSGSRRDTFAIRRSCELRTTARDGEHVRWKLSRFAVHAKLKPFGQKRLQHPHHLRTGPLTVRPRLEVVPIDAHPVRTADDGVVRNALHPSRRACGPPAPAVSPSSPPPRAPPCGPACRPAPEDARRTRDRREDRRPLEAAPHARDGARYVERRRLQRSRSEDRKTSSRFRTFRRGSSREG